MNDALKATVYFVQCAEHGPERRIYEDHDIRSQGGIQHIESDIERASYWFVGLGTILGHGALSGVYYTLEQFESLRLPERSRMRLGRLNPAFGRPAFDQRVFEVVFNTVDAFLSGWKYEDKQCVYLYALKSLDINPTLACISTSLATTRQVFCVIEASVVKYWGDKHWDPTATVPTLDTILDETSFPIAMELRIRGGDILAQVVSILQSASGGNIN